MATGVAGSIERLDRAMTETREPAGPWNAEFEKFYLEHYGRVVSVLFRLTPDRTQAEELAHEVFWKLYCRQLLPSDDGNVAGWLYRTATNLGIDALRRDARRRDYERRAARAAEQLTPESGPFEELQRGEQRRRVRQALARLKPVHARALILRASGFSYHEVAEALGVKRVSVGTLLIRAEEAFRKHYSPAGAGGSGARELKQEAP